MTRRAEFRVYPTQPQRIMLAKTFGCARLVWNDALGVFLDAYRSGKAAPKFGDVVKQVTSLAKRTPERAFLSEVSNAALQQSLNDLRTARNNLFASLAGKRKARKVGAPRPGETGPLAAQTIAGETWFEAPGSAAGQGRALA